MAEEIQKKSFEKIGDQYLLHYTDQGSTRYRRDYIFRPMAGELDLEGKIILDAMCGSGQLSDFLSRENCTLHALDLSEKQTQLYKKRFPGVRVRTASIVRTGYPDDYFDIIMICGGLHHVHPNVSGALTEVGRILKPGGFFVFCEPHAGSLFDAIRKLWYRHDHLFMENEASIDYAFLEKNFSGSFNTVKKRYFGNVAYYLIYNSLILRIPLSLKKWLAPPALALEKFLTPLHTAFLSSYMIARWQKK